MGRSAAVSADSRRLLLAEPTRRIVEREGALDTKLLQFSSHDDSPTLRAILAGHALVHFGLLPIELAAHQAAVITRLSGIVPNSILHVVLGSGSAVFAWRMRR